MTDKKTPEELAEESAHILCKELGDYRAFEFLRDNYLVGYEAGRPKWVSVEERLPQRNGTYAVIDCGLVKVLEYDTKLGWKLALTKVTHWQPLPTPPTKEG